MGELKFEHPHIPFYGNVPGGFGPGRKIKVRGKEEYSREPRFCINLGVAPMFRENIALHISARHVENCIVVTHCKQGIWGMEQRFPNPIHRPFREQFEFRINVEHDGYKVHLNDHHMTSIPFAYPPHMVNHIEIEGGVKIQHVHVEGHSEGGAMVVEGMVPPMAPIYRPPMVVEEVRPMMPGYGAPMMPAYGMPPMMPMGMPNTVIVEERRPNVVVVEPPRPVIYETPYYHHHHHHHGW